MSIDYSVCLEYGPYVHAIAMIESNENPALWGDDGQAFGVVQCHPANFAQYYGKSIRFRQSTSDTWTQAFLKTCASFFDLYLHNIGLDKTVVAWNQGVNGVLSEGKWNQTYLDRFHQALTSVS